MYGVPTNLDLRPFHGDYLTQVCLGSSDIQFRFGAGRVISVQGLWELKDAKGTLVDAACNVNSRLDPPHSFSLAFDNGMVLTVYDDNEQFESFSIQPGNIFV